MPKKPLPDHPIGTLAALSRLHRLFSGETQAEHGESTNLSREVVAQRERGVTKAYMRRVYLMQDKRAADPNLPRIPPWSSSKHLLVNVAQALAGRSTSKLREYYESPKHKELREYVQQCADELGMELPPKPLGEPASEANLALPWEDEILPAVNKYLAARWPGLSVDARGDIALEAYERALGDEGTAKADNPTGWVCQIAHNVALERRRTKKIRSEEVLLDD